MSQIRFRFNRIEGFYQKNHIDNGSFLSVEKFKKFSNDRETRFGRKWTAVNFILISRNVQLKICLVELSVIIFMTLKQVPGR